MAGGSGSVVVGRVSGLYGVKGWVKVYSYTEPRPGIVDYTSWRLRHRDAEGDAGQTFQIAEGRAHGKGVVAKLGGIDDRDAAAEWVGADILVDRQQFAATESGEYYWADLVGLRVTTPDGIELGVVDHLIATGANDVLVVEGDRRRLIPFVRGDVVRHVDLGNATIMVDWNPDY